MVLGTLLIGNDPFHPQQRAKHVSYGPFGFTSRWCLVPVLFNPLLGGSVQNARIMTLAGAGRDHDDGRRGGLTTPWRALAAPSELHAGQLELDPSPAQL